MSETECLGVAGQKRMLSAGETSCAKRTQLISPPGVLLGVLIIRMLVNFITIAYSNVGI